MRKQNRDAQIFQHGGAYQIYQILCLHYPKINTKSCDSRDEGWRELTFSQVLDLRSHYLYCTVLFLCFTMARTPWDTIWASCLFIIKPPSPHWAHPWTGVCWEDIRVFTPSRCGNTFFLAPVLRHLWEITGCSEFTGFWTGGSCLQGRILLL